MKKVSIYSIIVFLMIVSFGCASNHPKTAADIQSQLSQWQINTENPLLLLVPYDTPIIIASQRTVEETSTAIHTINTRLSSLIDSFGKTQNANLNSSNESSAKDFYLLENTDFVLYFNESSFIAHFSSADKDKVISELETKLIDKLQTKFGILTQSVQQINGKDWRIYSNKQDISNSDIKLGINKENEILSIVLFNEKIPENILTLKENHFSSSTFGKQPSDSVIAAHINETALGLLFSKDWIITRSLDNALQYVALNTPFNRNDSMIEQWISLSDDICQQDIHKYFNDFPELNISIGLNDKGLISLHLYQKLSDKYLNRIKNIAFSHPLFGTIHDDIHFELGADLAKLWENLQQTVSETNRENYQCSSIGTLARLSDYGIFLIKKNINNYEEFQWIIDEFRSANIVFHALKSRNNINHFFKFDINNLAQNAIPLISEILDLQLIEGNIHNINIGMDLGPSSIQWKGNSLCEGTNANEVESFCSHVSDNNHLLSAGLSQNIVMNYIEDMFSEDISLKDSNLWLRGVHLYTEPETNGFSIHIEETE